MEIIKVDKNCSYVMQRFFPAISFFSLTLISHIGALVIKDSIGNNVMLVTLLIILIFKILGEGESSSCNMKNFHLYFIANFLLIIKVFPINYQLLINKILRKSYTSVFPVCQTHFTFHISPFLKSVARYVYLKIQTSWELQH